MCTRKSADLTLSSWLFGVFHLSFRQGPHPSCFPVSRGLIRVQWEWGQLCTPMSPTLQVRCRIFPPQKFLVALGGSFPSLFRIRQAFASLSTFWNKVSVLCWEFCKYRLRIQKSSALRSEMFWKWCQADLPCKMGTCYPPVRSWGGSAFGTHRRSRETGKLASSACCGSGFSP